MMADHPTLVSGRRPPTVHTCCPSRDGDRSALSSIMQSKPNFAGSPNRPNTLFERRLGARRSATLRQNQTQSNPIVQAGGRRKSHAIRNAHPAPNKANFWPFRAENEGWAEKQSQSGQAGDRRLEAGGPTTEDGGRTTEDRGPRTDVAGTGTEGPFAQYARRTTQCEPRLTRRARAVYWRDVLVWQLL